MTSVFIVLWAAAASATDFDVWAAKPADIFILGEVHDNPVHHDRQAGFVAALSPKAVVFEMLTPDEARRVQGIERTALNETGVVDSHWSNIAEYLGVMTASEAVIVGAALPREAVRAAFSDGAAAVFGADADAYGLSDPVPPAQLNQREDLQFAAHCEAMPRDMMGGMVEAQRVRDAAFARATLQALQTYGAPVVLITGNGHARRDWGVPAFLARVAPGRAVVTIAQGEGGQTPDGGFDAAWDADPVAARPDPCAAFR